MGLLKAIGDSFRGTFADQWKDIYTAGTFDEHTVAVPAVLRNQSKRRGSNLYGSDGVISNGSVVYIPENTTAFIFSKNGIENILSKPGGYIYEDGQESFFNKGRVGSSIIQEAANRLAFGGISDDYKRIAFVNLREIRNITFGTHGPQLYNDQYYGVDLEIYAYGVFSVQVINPVTFITNFLPPNQYHYSFDNLNVRKQIVAEFLQSFMVALNSLSADYRVSQIPSHANDIVNAIKNDSNNAGTWYDRYGFQLISIGIENIELSDRSQDLINKYSEKKMSVKAFEDVSIQASNIAAQQKIAQGIQEKGFGDIGGMVYGMNMAQGINPFTAQYQPQSQPQEQLNPQKSSGIELTIDQQIEAVKKLKELKDAGILSEEEFERKKKDILKL